MLIETGTSSRTLSLAMSGYTIRVDDGAPVVSGNLSLDANAYYIMTYQKGYGSTVYINIAKYSNL